jgi:hypothetical protein
MTEIPGSPRTSESLGTHRGEQSSRTLDAGFFFEESMKIAVNRKLSKQKRYQLRMKRAKRCPRCGKKRTDKFINCATCRAKMKAGRERRKEAKEGLDEPTR